MSLQFEERIGWGKRVVLALFAAFACLAPYELLIKPGAALLTWGMAPFWAISIGALSVAAPPLAIAILGPTRRLRFDAAMRAILIQIEGDFGLRWSRRFAFAEIDGVDVRRDEDADRPDRFHVEARVKGRRRPLPVKTLGDAAEAEALAARLRGLLD